MAKKRLIAVKKVKLHGENYTAKVYKRKVGTYVANISEHPRS